MRVYELAKELGVSSKELVSLLQKMGIAASSHMSVISEDDAKKVKTKHGSRDQDDSSNSKAAKQPEKKGDSGKAHMIGETQKPVTTKKKKIFEKKMLPDEEIEDIESVPGRLAPKTTLKVEKAKSPTQTRTFKQKSYHGAARSVVKQVVPEVVTEITVSDNLPLFKVAEMMGKTAGELIMELLKEGMVCNRNAMLTPDIIKSVAVKFGIQVKKPEKKAKEDVLAQAKLDRAEGSQRRWPIVVVMGHVDHGKTTLLDYIRKMNVAAREKGGITQHISAYEVTSKHGKIVFMDTPGHEAFSYLRQHGVRITDIAILIIAADDGVKPQTIEALKHAKSAGVDIIVAINKMDKVSPAAIETIKRQLAEHDMLVEDWGGKVICMPISAKTGQGVDELLEMIVLQSELMDLKAFADRPARAFVLESRLEKGYGPVATVISIEGTIKQGDVFVCGDTTGKVRLLIDSAGQKIQEAGPSTPVQVVGFNDYPSMGDLLKVVSVQEYAKVRQSKGSLTQGAETDRPTEAAHGQATEKGRVINLIIKTDTRGSREALLGLIKKLEKLSIEVNCPVNIISTAVGDISEGDIELAENTHALLIGFHVKAEKNAVLLAKERHVDIKLYDIIYHLIEDLEKMLEKKRIIVAVWKQTGEATVRKVFKLKTGQVIAGCYLREGVCSRNSKVTCVRKKQVIGESKITSLQRDKKTVKEVHAGYEFAFITDTFQEWEEGDTILCFTQSKD